MATSFDLTDSNAIIQGDTFRWIITVTDTAGLTIDLTAYTLRGSIRKQYSDVAATATFVCTKSNQTTNKGEFVVTLTAVTTAGIAKGMYKYDIEMETGTEVHKLYRGIAQVLPEATK